MWGGRNRSVRAMLDSLGVEPRRRKFGPWRNAACKQNRKRPADTRGSGCAHRHIDEWGYLGIKDKSSKRNEPRQRDGYRICASQADRRREEDRTGKETTVSVGNFSLRESHQ